MRNPTDPPPAVPNSAEPDFSAEIPADVFAAPGSPTVGSPTLGSPTVGSPTLGSPTVGSPASPPSHGSRTRPSGSLSGGLPIHSIIDKYRIEELLGAGAFALVYRATHLLLRVPVALKLLRPELLRTELHAVETLCREAGLAAAVDHPNVVRVLDATSTGRIAYIIMELVDGTSLSGAIRKRKRLPVAEVLRIGRDACAGLTAALACGLIHRDVKPANILLTAAGVAKVADLGLALRVSSFAGLPGSSSRRLIGTPLYMSPEQAANPQSVDFRADIYSLGATLFAAAVGRPPFEADSSAEVLRLQREGTVPDVRGLRPELPAELAELLTRMLAKRPEDRPASYAELREGLAAVPTPGGD